MLNYQPQRKSCIERTHDTFIKPLYVHHLYGPWVHSLLFFAPSHPLVFQERRWAEFPNVSFTFDCTDRPIGFYADLEFDCMIFHMCDEDGRRIPYMCANETSFNQKFRVCDWNYNVDCEASPDWYYLNDLTYRTDPPKVEDDFGLSEENIRKWKWISDCHSLLPNIRALAWWRKESWCSAAPPYQIFSHSIFLMDFQWYVFNPNSFLNWGSKILVFIPHLAFVFNFFKLLSKCSNNS